MSCKLCMIRKLKQSNCSSFQLENLGILTAHEKTKQMTLKGGKVIKIADSTLSFSFFFSMQCKMMEREICKCKIHVTFGDSFPPSWLTDRVEGNTHSVGRMLERPDTAFEVVPWWPDDLFVGVPDTLRCLEYVEWELRGSAASYHRCCQLWCWGRVSPRRGHDNLELKMSVGQQRVEVLRSN